MLADTLESLRQHSKLKMFALFCPVSNLQFKKKMKEEEEKGLPWLQIHMGGFKFLQTNCFRYIDFLICVWLIELTD